MPSFHVTGLSAKRRKIGRKVQAETEQGARKKAERDGVTVETVTRLPSETATDRQLAYAQSLGIQIPVSPTLEQMSNLISRAVEPAASSWLVGRARVLGADIDQSRYLGLAYVSRQVNEAIGLDSHAGNVELAFWYLHSVLKHRLKAKWSSPSESQIPDAQVFSLAEAIVSNEKAFKSLRREYRDGPVYAYVEFGDGYGGTMSTRTSAFVSALNLVEGAGLC